MANWMRVGSRIPLVLWLLFEQYKFNKRPILDSYARILSWWLTDRSYAAYLWGNTNSNYKAVSTMTDIIPSNSESSKECRNTRRRKILWNYQYQGEIRRTSLLFHPNWTATSKKKKKKPAPVRYAEATPPLNLQDTAMREASYNTAPDEVAWRRWPELWDEGLERRRHPRN